MLVRTSTIDTMSHEVDGSTYRSADIGPINVGEVALQRELHLESDDVGAGYYVQLPIAGRFRSRHRGVELLVNPLSAPVYQPGSAFAACWPIGYRALCVRIDSAAVESALSGLPHGGAAARLLFDPVLNVAAGPGRSWAELMFSVNRQLSVPHGLLSDPLVAAPMAESLMWGFLRTATRSHPEMLVEPAAPLRPVSVRTACDVIEAAPQEALTVSALADRCGVSRRALQKAFQHHLGMSPMAYLREVRLRRAHEDLRCADPFTESVAAVARRWGFGHLGRFAAAHEAKYGQTPLRTLRG
jgi:AraC-like DNA-binding protein